MRTSTLLKQNFDFAPFRWDQPQSWFVGVGSFDWESFDWESFVAMMDQIQDQLDEHDHYELVEIPINIRLDHLL
jgi:hypothetical protein